MSGCLHGIGMEGEKSWECSHKINHNFLDIHIQGQRAIHVHCSGLSPFPLLAASTVTVMYHNVAVICASLHGVWELCGSRTDHIN